MLTGEDMVLPGRERARGALMALAMVGELAHGGAGDDGNALC